MKVILCERQTPPIICIGTRLICDIPCDQKTVELEREGLVEFLRLSTQERIDFILINGE